MRKYLCLFIGLSFITTCFSQTAIDSCARFRSGKFAYRDSSGTTCEITRTPKKQVEYNPQTKVKTRFKIDWLNDCQYKLTQVWASSPGKRKLNRSTLVYRIVSVTGDTYAYSCTCSDNSKVAGTVVKME